LPEAILEVVDGIVVTMAHARVMSEFLGDDPSTAAARSLADETRRHGWSAAQLRASLRRARRGHGGRPRRFVSVSGAEVRVYPLRMGADTSGERINAAIDALRSAIAG